MGLGKKFRSLGKSIPARLQPSRPGTQPLPSSASPPAAAPARAASPSTVTTSPSTASTETSTAPTSPAAVTTRAAPPASPAASSTAPPTPPTSTAESSATPFASPASAATRSAAPAAPPASATANSTVSQPPSTPPASSLFPFMYLVKHPDSTKKAPAPRLVYVSASTDLRLIYADSLSSEPSSLVDFRSPDFRLELKRMSHNSSTPPLSLDTVAASRVCPEADPSGLAVRVTDERRSILLIAASEEQRDAFIAAVSLRVAPWPVLREVMEAEMRDAGVPATPAPSLADAARSLFSEAAGVSDGSPGSESEAGKKRAAGFAKVVWEKAGTMAQASLWAATLAQGLGGIARTAEEVEKLAKPLGGLTVVGCAFSVVALSARAVNLMALEREGREKLISSRDDLRDASVSIVGWLFSILASGFSDEDGLVGRVFDVLGECWNAADDLEQYLLHHWPVRAWNAEDVREIALKVDSVKGKLLGVGLLKTVAEHERRIDDHDTRIVKIEGQASYMSVDRFEPYSPEPSSYNLGLVENAATSLAQLKTAVLGTEGSAELGHSSKRDSGSSLRRRRVALTSINGEGGVGKTSTCKLLCMDEEVRARFSDGAILWIDVGRDATEEKVKGELESSVLLCRGERSAELIRLARDVRAAVEIARLFFAKRRVLVIVDNIWETPSGSSVTSWAETISRIVSCPESAAIVTTRFVSLARTPGFSHVQLGRLDLATEQSPDWGIAEKLYDVLLDAETKVQSSCEYKKSRKRALVLSCGLPLGITTFAGLVQSYGETDDVEAVLSNIEQRVLGLGDKVVGEDLKASTGHPGLFAAMEESLLYLDQRERRDCRVKSMPLCVRNDVDRKDTRAFRSSYNSFVDHPLSARYTALEVMLSSSPSLSFPLLCRLWHVQSVADAKSIARLFVNVGLGRIEGGEEKAFILHDLQYGFCARDRSTETAVGAVVRGLSALNGHSLLLASCESLLSF